VRLTTLLIFGAGYVLGTKAGRERYAQIVTAAERASKRLQEYSARHRADGGDITVDKPDRGSRRRQAAL
jgi:hypothetical protein